MWAKDGKNYNGGGVIAGGRRHLNPSDADFRAAGYEWIEPPAPEPPEPPEPAPKRYSKLKIIRALGEAWREKRDELEAAGMFDEFLAAQYLATDDPVFSAIYEHLTDEEKRILDEECSYDD